MKIAKGKGTIATRKVAFLIADGVSQASIDAMKTALEKEPRQS